MIKIILLLIMAQAANAQQRVEVTNAPTFSLVTVAPSPIIYASSTTVLLSSTVYTSLFLANYSGDVEAVMFNFDRQQIQAAMKIDGIEVFNADLETLSTLGLVGLADGASTASAFPIVVARAGKQLFIRFSKPRRVGTSLEVLAIKKVTGATSLVGASVVYGVNQ